MIGPAKPVDDCGRIAYGDAMGLRIGALIVDSQDPGRLARFWAAALDWVISKTKILSGLSRHPKVVAKTA